MLPKRSFRERADSSSSSCSTFSHCSERSQDKAPSPTGIMEEDVRLATEGYNAFGRPIFYDSGLKLVREFADREMYVAFFHREWPYGNRHVNNPWPGDKMSSEERVNYKRSCHIINRFDTQRCYPPEQWEELEDVCQIVESKRRKKNDPIIENSPARQVVTDQKVPQMAPLTKPRPITVAGISDVSTFARELSEKTGANFQIKISGKFIKILTESIEDKKKIMQTLLEHKIQFFNNIERPNIIKAVIRGLPPTYDTEEIREALIEKGFEIINVSQMKSKKDGRTLPLFYLQLQKNEENRKIFEVKNLRWIRIQIEVFRPGNKATQCYKCQNFYHIAENCNLLPRCAICSESHETQDCPKKALSPEEKSKNSPKCCNCGENHVASYKGCKAYPEKQQVRKSYANVVKNSEVKTERISNTKVNYKKDRKISKDKNLVTQNLYEIEEFTTGAEELITIIRKIKKELNIENMTEYINKWKNCLRVIETKKDSIEKAVTFVGQLEKSFSAKNINMDTSSDLNS